MFGIVNFGAYIVACVILAIIPGTDTIFILGKTIANGKKVGIYSALGICNGILVHTLLATFGLSLILKQSEFAFNLVKTMGAIYLFYIGVKTLKTKSSVLEIENEKNSESLKKAYLQGVVANILNPKVAIFFLAFLPQFIDAEKTGSSVLAFAILGLLSLLISGIWNVGLAFFAGIISDILNKKQNINNYVNKISGIIFILLALNLLYTKLI